MKPLFEHPLIPELTNKPAYHVIGMKESHRMNTDGPIPAIAEQWVRFMGRIHEIEKRENPTVGVCLGLPDQGSLDYLAGALVHEDYAEIPGGMCRLVLEPQTYAVFTHRGPLAALGSAYAAIQRWLDTNEAYTHAPAPQFEYYDHRYKDAYQSDSEFDIYVPVIKTGSLATD